MTPQRHMHDLTRLQVLLRWPPRGVSNKCCQGRRSSRPSAIRPLITAIIERYENNSKEKHIGRRKLRSSDDVTQNPTDIRRRKFQLNFLIMKPKEEALHKTSYSDSAVNTHTVTF